MEMEVQKHLRGIRILVTLALLVACLSVAFTYILFRDVSVPLERWRSQEFNTLQSKVDNILATRLNGRMDVELRAAIQAMEELKLSGPKELQEQAQKAIDETKALRNLRKQLHKAKAAKAAKAAK